MKKLIYLFLLSPILGFSQAATDYLIFEITTLKTSPANAAQVESGLASHNKKYHGPGPSGVRVYTVESGTDVGAYKWVMGPAPWSHQDTRPMDDMHNMDYDSKVNVYLQSEGNNEFIRYDPKLSRFPADFNVDKLLVRYFDVARGKMDKVKELLDKVHKVYMDKIPNETYGIYWNELTSTSSGRDLVIVSFFDKFAWMSTDDGFDAKYEEVYGKGTLTEFWNEWRDATVGVETEIWRYHEDLSGLPPLVKAAERQ